MKILIVEDNDEKFDIIQNKIVEKFPWFKVEISRASSVIEYVRLVNAVKYDLQIFDILLPRRRGDDEFDASIEILDELEATVNSNTKAVALTAMLSPEYETLVRFNKKGIPVLSYAADEPECLDQLIEIIEVLDGSQKVDFVIACALQKEADAFEGFELSLGPWVADVGAFQWRGIIVGGLKGVICLFPRVGMTNAALSTSKAIERFRPKLVVTSGICAGVDGECRFLDIIVPESAWDHQVGKITDDGFKQELYPEIVDPDIISLLKHEWRKADFKKEMKSEIRDESEGKYNPEVVFGPVASGSVVVASSAVVAKIESQQRKVVGIEMEIAAIFTACTYSSVKPMFFAAKAVVDFADAAKSDFVHAQASRLAAKYILSMLPLVFQMQP
ncbi:hypothetical protein [Loktanella salsilacus]|uniref:phosphorylase family protein n=1 Tax=Loktanella salsilacus TaxID=195913 RepID=UPI0039890924